MPDQHSLRTVLSPSSMQSPSVATSSLHGSGAHGSPHGFQRARLTPRSDPFPAMAAAAAAAGAPVPGVNDPGFDVTLLEAREARYNLSKNWFAKLCNAGYENGDFRYITTALKANHEGMK